MSRHNFIEVHDDAVDGWMEVLSEKFQQGLTEESMIAYIDDDTLTELLKDSGITYYGGRYREVGINRIAGVDVVRSQEKVGIEYEIPPCDNCDNQKLYHDSDEKWYCPWCK